MKKGFTLIEVIIVLGATSLMLAGILSITLLTERAIRGSYDRGEIAQNARIALERLSRDIRQAETLVTSIPANDDDPANPPPSQLEFQDGNDPDALNYIRYYLSGANLQRELSYYSFPSDPTVRVEYNATDGGGNPPVKTVTEDELAAEYASSLEFYGATLITVDMTLDKNDADLTVTTTLYARNLP